MRGLSILGSTGSIGRSALDVISAFPDRFKVLGLAAGRNLELLARQIKRFRPLLAAVELPEDVPRLRRMLGDQDLDLVSGEEGASEVASLPEAQVVLTAMVGAAGLRPTLAAIQKGAVVAIANKEPLAMAGQLCLAEARRCGATLLPVDSEHSAIFQCLQGHSPEHVRRLLITGSGGAFRDSPADLSRVTRDQALEHPTWSMGPKISVDSATLMNKGLEVIEARWLFDIPPERIEVLIHPQSIVHSMVELVDGSVMAQLGPVDMRLPILHALGYPERLPAPFPFLDLTELGALTFEQPDRTRFPCLGLAYTALQRGGLAPAVLNAANEVAVQAFLQQKISYLDIARIIQQTLTQLSNEGPSSPEAYTLEQVLAADAEARCHAHSVIPKFA